MKDKIYFQLTLLRDKPMFSWLRDIIDYMRYEWFWDECKHIENKV